MSSTVSNADLVSRVIDLGIADPTLAERAIRATIAALGQRLTDDEAAAVAARMPPELARVLDQNEYDYDFDDAELYRRVQRAENASAADAREHTAVVLRAIGEAIDPNLRARLVRVLPAEVARNLVPRELAAPPPYAFPRRAVELHTLASGRVGSLHSLAESGTTDAQENSVVRSTNPHGETKLSSACGLTQERHRESLATGKPPAPSRRVSDTSDE